MTPEEIQKMLSLGEGQRIEFKSSIRSVGVIGKVVCGFLNSSGGYLICGIDERGPVPGIDASEEKISQLERKLYEGISPRAYVSLQVEELEGKLILIIEVPAGKDVPYAFDNVFYIRDGERSKTADAETIRDMIMRREIEPERWERRFSIADIGTDVDTDEVQAAVQDAFKVRRAFFRQKEDPFMVLEDFSAAKYGRLTNGGDVLFCHNPSRHIPQIRIRAMRYNSDKAGEKFSDNKTFEGPLYTIFEEAYSFIVRNTPSVSRFIKGDPKRQDAPLYPEDAVREALINALAHRDYAAASGGVAIHIYPNRLEIWNSGPLPDGVTEENLPLGHISVLRNPDIAHVLYMRGLMEKAGRGSVLMIKKCRESGLRDPVWKSDPKLGVTVTFFAPEVTPEVTTEVLAEVATEVKKLVLAIEGEHSRAELQDLLGLKDAEHFRKSYLNSAVEAGLVELTIPEKPRSPSQKYRHTDKGRQVKKMLERDGAVS